MKLSISDLLQLIAILGLVAAVVYGILKFVQDFIQAESRKRENYYKSFDTVVAQLSSDVKTSQLSAAILLRRYFKDTGNKKRADLHLEAVNVISSLLKESKIPSCLSAAMLPLGSTLTGLLIIVVIRRIPYHSLRLYYQKNKFRGV